MTGRFTPAVRVTPCVFGGCMSVLQPGAWVYLWRGLANQTVCPACALKRWGYVAPTEQPSAPEPTKSRIYVADGKLVQENFATFERTNVGAELKKNILTRRQLEQINATDPKLRAAGDQ